MLAEFGVRVRQHLTRLYFAAKKLWKDESGALKLPSLRKSPEGPPALYLGYPQSTAK
jgi:hypothetical protein